MYLFEVEDFSTAKERASLPKRSGGGNGPIIFQGETTLLYGESVYLGDGYFHLVDSTTGAASEADYLTFTAGLAAATYGPEGAIYATTGEGGTIYKIQGSDKELIATTDHAAQGIASDGNALFVSEREVKEDFITTVVTFSVLWPRGPERRPLLGDTNGDGTLGLADALYILQTLSGIRGSQNH
jgi:hypothetical protein